MCVCALIIHQKRRAGEVERELEKQITRVAITEAVEAITVDLLAKQTG